MNQFLRNTLVVIAASFATFLTLEFGYKIYGYTKGKVSIYKPDSLTGWSPRPGIKYTKTLYSSAGRPYSGTYVTDDQGFRKISSDGNRDSKISSTRHKILVIGDSFTGDFYSSNEDAWFSVLGEDFPLDVYAYGMGGSGTYQQFLAFKKLYKRVKPNILLIQVCINDPENDSYVYSFNSIVRNQDLRRPYWVGGKTVYRSGFLESLYRVLYNHSDLFKRFDLLHQLNQYSSTGSYSLNPVTETELIQQISNWRSIYSLYIKTAKELGIKSIWSVSCSSDLKYKAFTEAWVQVSSSHGVKVFPSFANAISVAASEGVDVFYADGGHLSDLGNQVAGNALAQEIKADPDLAYLHSN